MRRYVLLIAIVGLLFTACSRPDMPQLLPSDEALSTAAYSQPDMSQPLTSDEALSIVEESVQDCEDELFCEYNGKQTIADTEYHRIRVYTVSTEWLYDIDGTPYKQSFTYAWLYVDIHTGKIYQEESGKIDVLVPWP